VRAGGSSPRAWGTRQLVAHFAAQRRFIPTCVGNTLAPTAAPRKVAVHPHVRGEHPIFADISLASDGSSPRAWGTLGKAGRLAGVGRFIPTCVGNTHDAIPAKQRETVHPHVRGEHRGHQRGLFIAGGSSPRAWGTHFPAGCERGQELVHPHVRGEHAVIGDLVDAQSGSSPRAWGTPTCARWRIPRGRFIPTCVGNTKWGQASLRKVAVHPHVRGEHGAALYGRRGFSGSSPRAWGTRCRCRMRDDVARFIPTCVGNTRWNMRSSMCLTVHPHVRGEHRGACRGCVSCAGSSPRAWGTPGWACPARRAGRFIPTCVGNTVTAG